MAWPNPLRKKDQNTRSCWDYTFQWTALHQSAEELHPMKFTYDKLAEECLERLNEISADSTLPGNPGWMSQRQGNAPSKDLYALLRDNASEDEKLGELWRQISTVPDWVDWDQIRRGQDVFYRYGLPALNALNFESLLGGMSSGRVVETLSRTGGFSTKVARQRLFETTQYVFQITRSLDSIKPGGDGHAASVRVRFLHAAVRQRIMKLAQQRPEYYNVEKFGIPINDLDCIATITAFSTIVIWLGLPRQGLWLRDQEISDYIALWRLVAYYQGTPTEPFATGEKAKAMMESVLSEVQPTRMSQILAKNIILSLENTSPSYASHEFMEVMARWLNGKQLSDRLDIGNPPLYYWALVTGYCLWVMAICYISRAIPRFDRRNIEFRRKLYYRLIVTEKKGLGKESLFDFKHIPNYNHTTELGESNAFGVKKTGIEMLGYLGLGAAVVVMSLGCGGAMLFRHQYSN